MSNAQMIEQGRIECQIPLPDLTGFWEWFNAQPAPSPYKEPIKVKVCKSWHISKLRDTGHKYFDMLWRELKIISRPEAYEWLAGYMGLSSELAHFSRFNEAQCIEAIEGAIQLINDNRRLDFDITGFEPYPFYHLSIKL